MNSTLLKFETRDELIEKLGIAIVAQLKAGIEKRNYACLAVSGGNSPKPLFEYLSNQTLAWDKVFVTLVDERWVDGASESSNTRLVKSTLLKNKASLATFIDLYNGADTPFIAEKKINASLKEIRLPFDAVLLGMGDDGHTASFFPNSKQLKNALLPSSDQRCCGIEPPIAPHQRMTLTLPTLLQSEALYLLLTGASKFPILQQAMEPMRENALLLEGEQELDPKINEYPVRSVIHQDSCPLAIYYSE